MEIEKKNTKNDKMDWTPIILFYVKTTSWIVLPLVIAVLVSRKIAPGYHLLFVALGFGITCYGIYKEIKQYKKDLDK